MGLEDTVTATPTTKVIIKTLGFPDTAGFQRAWALGDALTVDGKIGAKTQAAARTSWARHLDNKGDLSEHFSAHEFACHCGGKLEGCKGLIVYRSLLLGLEEYRTKFSPNGLTIVSGYRCEKRNAAVGGVPGSKHILGEAADLSGLVTVAKVKGLKRFGGIGYCKSNSLVLHVDVRKESKTAPTTWTYKC